MVSDKPKLTSTEGRCIYTIEVNGKEVQLRGSEAQAIRTINWIKMLEKTRPDEFKKIYGETPI